MNRDRAKELLPVIQAYADGAKLQCRPKQGEWVDLNDGEEPLWLHNTEYRVKTREPRTFKIGVNSSGLIRQVRPWRVVSDTAYCRQHGYNIIEVQEVIKE